MYYPTLEEVKKLKKQGTMVPIYREIVADLETPVSAFLKVNRNGRSFLLESVEGGERMARYSFIGTDPYRVLTVRGEDKADPLPLIAEELDKHNLSAVNKIYNESISDFEGIRYTAVASLPASELRHRHLARKMRHRHFWVLKIGDTENEINQMIIETVATIQSYFNNFGLLKPILQHSNINLCWRLSRCLDPVNM